MTGKIATALVCCISDLQPHKHRTAALGWLRTRYQRQRHPLDLSAHALVGYTPLRVWAAYHRRYPYSLPAAPAAIFRALAAYLDGYMSPQAFSRTCLAIQIAEGHKNED